MRGLVGWAATFGGNGQNRGIAEIGWVGMVEGDVAVGPRSVETPVQNHPALKSTISGVVFEETQPITTPCGLYALLILQPTSLSLSSF